MHTATVEIIFLVTVQLAHDTHGVMSPRFASNAPHPPHNLCKHNSGDHGTWCTHACVLLGTGALARGWGRAQRCYSCCLVFLAQSFLSLELRRATTMSKNTDPRVHQNVLCCSAKYKMHYPGCSHSTTPSLLDRWVWASTKHLHTASSSVQLIRTWCLENI